MTAYEFERVFRHERFSDYLIDGGAKMPSGRRTTGNGTKRQCREMVTLMEQDPTIGLRIDGWVYTVTGVTGRYLIIQKKREAEGIPWIEVETMYISDFVDIVYNNGNNKDVKVVRA